MENISGNSAKEGKNPGEEIFDNINKIIDSWFKLLRITVWALGIILVLFVAVGIVFFGYDMRETRNEFKERFQEFDQRNAELENKRNIYENKIDSLNMNIEKQLKEIDIYYSERFRTLRLEIGKKANVRLPERFDEPFFSEPLKPRTHK